MKKIMFILLIICLLLFTNVEYNEKEAKDNSLLTQEYSNGNSGENNHPIELAQLSYEEKNDYIMYTFEDYLSFIGIEKNQLIKELGQPEDTFYLYGGNIDMYENNSVGFGTDDLNDCINSILIYEGIIPYNIEIGMDKTEILKLLNYNENKYNYFEGEENYSVVIEYKEYIIYMNFYEDILKEVLIKLNDKAKY